MFAQCQRKYSSLFAKVALFAFSFAWIICMSHSSFVSPRVPTHTQASPANHEESEIHNMSCIDHTQQISTRNQCNVFSGDFDNFSIPAPTTTFDFSFVTLALNTKLIYELDQRDGETIFLKNTVLLL